MSRVWRWIWRPSRPDRDPARGVENRRQAGLALLESLIALEQERFGFGVILVAHQKSGENRKSPEQIDAAIRQLVSKAITTEGEIIDVFTAAGSSAPTARDMPAQGTALGRRRHFIEP